MGEIELNSWMHNFFFKITAFTFDKVIMLIIHRNLSLYIYIYIYIYNLYYFINALYGQQNYYFIIEIAIFLVTLIC